MKYKMYINSCGDLTYEMFMEVFKHNLMHYKNLTFTLSFSIKDKTITIC
jgi:hypothetical protein